MKYINNFASLIPALQGNKAVRKVEKLREIGQIQTEAEYNATLATILQKLSTEDFEPTLTYQPFVPGISSSEHYNNMADQIRDDLEVAFTEVNNIYAAIKAHNMIFKDKVINELYSAIEELEKELNRLTIVADTENSFDDAFINTFSGDVYRMDRLDRFATELLYDRRTNESMSDADNAYVDNDEELLTLPLLSQKDINFSQVAVINTQTTGSDYDIQLVDSSVDAVINGDTSSGWIHNILKQDSLTEGARLVIDADLGDKRLVNYLTIKPVSDFPSVLVDIKYMNENNQLVTLPETSLFDSVISGPVKISFDDIIAKKFILTFSQRSSTLFSYNSNVESITIDDLRRNTSLAANAQMLQDQINSQVASVDMLSVLPIAQQPTPEYQVLYQYTFGFTHITTGLKGYRERGHFVSKAYRKSAPGLIAIEADEIDTQYLDEVAGLQASVGSFEYSLIKKDYNERGEVIGSSEMPILPINKTSVVQERLPFTGTTLIVPLRFLGHSTANKGDTVEVYRNNILLVRGVDWTFEDRADNADLSDEDLKPSMTSTRIRILQSSDLIRNGIYTANYTPRHIAEPNNIISYQDIVFLDTNVTEHSIDAGSETVFESDLFVKITIRNNSFYDNKTPKLASYKLLASSVDSDKFVRL